MTSVWTRGIRAKSPLPEADEVSLSVAYTVYQGSARLYIRLTSRQGGKLRHSRDLVVERLERPRETVLGALLELQDIVERKLAELEAEGTLD